MQVGIGGIEGLRRFLGSKVRGLICIRGKWIPGGVVVNHIAEIVLHIDSAETPSRPETENPIGPGGVLTSGDQTGENGAASRILTAAVDFLQRGDLRRGETTTR